MRGWSFPVGTFFGVELRIHTFFVLLFAFSISYATYLNVGVGRGIGLWLLLLLAVAVREVARVLAAAWYGLDLRAIVLMPTGGLFAYGIAPAGTTPITAKIERRLALVGPITSFVFGGLMAAIILTFAPSVDLLSLKWIAPDHLLRTLVWINLLLGLVNLLPAWPLDGGRLFRNEFVPPGSVASSAAARLLSALSPAIALGLIVAGLIMTNMWMILIGIMILLAAQLEQQSLLFPPAPPDGPPQPGAPLSAQAAAEAVTMRDVMLTDFTTLSASATLEDAMRLAGHTLQDVYPVVRGRNLVGAVSRQNIVDALESTGNSYVQGVMTRTFQTAAPGDSLVLTLRRIMNTLAGQGAQLVPIVEGERIVGIITPQNLQRSMTMLNRTRRMKMALGSDDDLR